MDTFINETPKLSSSELRRSANYKPTIWEHDLVQSLATNYSTDEEIYAKRKENLKEQVTLHLLNIIDKEIMVSLAQSHAQLEMIDDLERLGLGYLFEKEIKLALDRFHGFNNTENVNIANDLHCVSLSFRLFRQHGYMVSQDVFKKFMDQQGNFIINDSNDIKGTLSLFEASFLGLEGEHILDTAKVFTSKYLKEYYHKGVGVVGNANNVMRTMMKQIEHALELPRHLRMLRLEARWYIDEYAKRETVNHVLLELAKLEFNMVQSTHQQDLKHISKWWRDLKLVEKLRFARDRVVECFLASVGITFEPQFAYCRRGITKVCALITTIDDVYDIYGTLDELELFTSVVERWNIDDVAQLPDYLKICFLALYNTVNEFAYDILKENGFDVLTYLKNAWTDLCKSFLVEAKWYYSGYVPTFEEYLDIGWNSSGGFVILLHAYVFSSKDITVETLKFLESKPNLIRWPSMILRLTDDLETSSDEIERGDVPKSIECYMQQARVSEKVAREYIQRLLDVTWKKMNKELYLSGSSPTFTHFVGNIGANLGRMSHCMFQYGDGYGNSDTNTKDNILSLLFKPILLIE